MELFLNLFCALVILAVLGILVVRILQYWFNTRVILQISHINPVV
jgi:uncharacterized membrane protein